MNREFMPEPSESSNVPAESVETAEPSIFDEPVEPAAKAPTKPVIIDVTPRSKRAARTARSPEPTSSPPVERTNLRAARTARKNTPSDTPPDQTLGPLRAKPIPRMDDSTRVPADAVIPITATSSEPTDDQPRRWTRFDRPTVSDSPASSEPSVQTQSRLEWSRRVVFGVAKGIFENYDVRKKSAGDLAWLFGGALTNYGLLMLSSQVPDADKIIKPCLIAGLGVIPQFLYGRSYFNQEEKLRREFSGPELQAELDSLWKKHYSSMGKVERALRNFTAGAVLGGVAEHFTGEQASQAIHNVTSNVSHEMPSTIIGGRSAIKVGQTVTENQPVVSTHIPGWKAPWDGKLPWDHAATPAAAPTNASVVEASPTEVPAAANLPKPPEAPASANLPPVKAIPNPAAPALDSPPGIKPGSFEPVFQPGASALEDLKLVDHNGVISDADFLKVLEHQGADSHLQQEISAQVGKHEDLMDKFAKQAAETRGVDPSRIAEYRLGIQHQYEAYANKVFKDQIVESFKNNESLYSALEKADATYNSSIDSLNLIQPAAAEIVSQHPEITHQIVDQTLAEKGVPASQISITEYEDINRGVQQALVTDTGSYLYYPPAYVQMLDGHLNIEQALSEGTNDFDQFANSGGEHNYLLTVANDSYSHFEALSQTVRDHVEGAVPQDSIEMVDIPVDTTFSQILENHNYQVDWTPGQPQYLETVDLFAAESTVNYDGLVAYFNELASSGSLGENPHFPVPLYEIGRLAADARDGNQAAMERLVEIMHWIKPGTQLKVLTPDQVASILNAVGRPRRPDNMQKVTYLDQVLTILKKEGYTDEQLAQFVVDLTKLNFEKLYLQAAASFTDADLDLIDKAQKHEVEGVIRKLYRERIGKDPEKETTEMINVFCQGFLKEYHSQKPST